MYIARFETDEGEYVQAIARIGVGRPTTDRDGELWWDEVARRLVTAARIPGTTVARRIAVDEERRLRQIVSVIAPADRERQVREVFAAMTRLERLIGGSLTLPSTRAEHDAWLEDLGALRWCATERDLGVSGVPVAFDLRIAPKLDDLLAEACVSGYALTYQLNVRSAAADADWVRAARKNVLHLQGVPGARPSLIGWQEELARGLGHATAFGEEYLTVETESAAEAVGALLADRFRSEYAQHGFRLPTPSFQRDAFQDPLFLGVHSHDLLPLSAVELAGAALSGTERDRLLAWRPSARVRALLSSDAGPPPDEEEAADRPPPAPWSGPPPFAFVSYKRADIGRITPVLELSDKLGLPYWYDRGIPGGAEWDAVIEDHLRRCSLLLLFVSRAAIDSKYVRREVKFADALDVPLLSILLEDTPLVHGLGMLLTQYQMLDARSPDFANRMRGAVQSFVGAAGTA